MITAKQLVNLIRQQQFTPTTYPLPFSNEEAESLLTEAVKAQIKRRGGQMQESSSLRNGIKEVARWLTTMTKPSLFLCGIVGNGKTTMVKAIQNIYQFADIKDWKNEKVGVALITAKELCKAWKEDRKLYRIYLEQPILAVDDLGNEPKEILDYGNIGNPMIELFERRYDKQLTTIITSNLTAKQIREDYYDRVADRFNEMMTIVPFTDQSFRGKNNVITIKQVKNHEKTT